MSRWYRKYEGTVHDPKWRLIARRAGVHVAHVRDLFEHMLDHASVASNGGSLDRWDDEVVATNMDVDTDVVARIREAMQGVVLEGDVVRAWERRQDYSTNRVREFRERQRAAISAPPAIAIGDATGTSIQVTATPAVLPLEKPGEDIPKKKKAEPKRNRSRLPDDAKLSEDDVAAAIKSGLSIEEAAAEWDRFCNHHGANGSLMLSWHKAWLKWLYRRDAYAPRVLPSTSMTQDHQPNDRDKSAASEYGLTSQEFREDWRAFRNHYLAKGAKKADWSAAWRAWLDDRKKGLFASRAQVPAGHEDSFVKAARKRLEELENVTSDTGSVTTIASTLPDAAFRTASDPELAGSLGNTGSPPILDLEPIRARQHDAECAA